MLTKQRNRKVKKYQWVLGFLGFIGFAGILGLKYLHDSSLFLFFGFFGFFSSYWDYKIQQDIMDERLANNQLKANNIAFRIGFGLVWIGAILLNTMFINVIPILKGFEYRYALMIILIALGFSIILNIASYLTYKYETQE